MTTRVKLEFPGGQGALLAALLEKPDTKPRHCAVFLHCFTCGKDSKAASTIASTLVQQGIAVLRFDFTGIGQSDGEFANSGFSANVEDVLSACAYLTRHYMRPNILIGHSLGGLAAVYAAEQLDHIDALITIGAPSCVQHIEKQYQAHLDDIADQGSADVQLGGRQFRIAQAFVDDIRAHDQRQYFKTAHSLHTLILHAPSDEVVTIDQAEALFTKLQYPKSLQSLVDADHLLLAPNAAHNAADAIIEFLKRISVLVAQPLADVPTGKVLVTERDHKFLLDVTSDHHHWLADEPTDMGGENRGPDPYEHLLASLGACTAMTLRMYASHKDWPLENVKVLLTHSREHRQDCEQCSKAESHISILHRKISIIGPLTADQRNRMLEIADKCPVHRTLTGSLTIKTQDASNSDQEQS